MSFGSGLVHQESWIGVEPNDAENPIGVRAAPVAAQPPAIPMQSGRLPLPHPESLSLEITLQQKAGPYGGPI